MKETTKRILNAIQEGLKKRGIPPTLREIASAAGLKSTWTVRYHLKKLVSEGYINMKQNLSRGISLIRETGGIPVLGRIRAGKPEEAVENAGEHIESLSGFFGGGEMFALKVKGDSMIEAGIFEGYTVIVKKQNTADSGDIVAAMVDGEATVKKLKRTGKVTSLEAANPAYAPIVSKEIIVIGKVTGVMRRYK